MNESCHTHSRISVWMSHVTHIRTHIHTHSHRFTPECVTFTFTATHCTTLQRTATHCKTLQHTFKSLSTNVECVRYECLCNSFTSKEPFWLVALLRKETCNLGHPMHLRHPAWMRHVTHVQESLYEWVIVSHTLNSLSMNESYHTHSTVFLSMSHVTNITNIQGSFYEWVTFTTGTPVYLWMSLIQTFIKRQGSL